MAKRKQMLRNQADYDCLSSVYFVKGNSLLDQYSHKAHDLYNRALYDLRQGPVSYTHLTLPTNREV